MNHSFVQNNLHNHPMKHRALKKLLPKVPTKASKLRDEHLKNYRDQLENSRKEEAKPEWKLRQFLGIGPSDDIAETIKRIKKHGNYLVIHRDLSS